MYLPSLPPFPPAWSMVQDSPPSCGVGIKGIKLRVDKGLERVSGVGRSGLTLCVLL